MTIPTTLHRAFSVNLDSYAIRNSLAHGGIESVVESISFV